MPTWGLLWVILGPHRSPLRPPVTFFPEDHRNLCHGTAHKALKEELDKWAVAGRGLWTQLPTGPAGWLFLEAVSTLGSHTPNTRTSRACVLNTLLHSWGWGRMSRNVRALTAGLPRLPGTLGHLQWVSLWSATWTWCPGSHWAQLGGKSLGIRIQCP